MIKKLLSNKFTFLIIFCALSFLAGAINGFVGTGGGIIFVFMLSKMTELEKKDIFATSLFATVLISSISLFNYIRLDCIEWGTVFKSAAPALFGGIFGAFLVDKISTRWLSAIFAAILIYSGVYLIL